MIKDPQEFMMESHPPERGQTKGVYAACGCSCCCCCCCIHSLGAIAGAVYASAHLHKKDCFLTSSRAILAFWVLFAITLFGGFLAGGDSSSAFWIPLFCAPAVIAALDIFLLVIFAIIPSPNKGSSLRTLGRILGFSILGTIGGTLLMGGAYLVLN